MLIDNPYDQALWRRLLEYCSVSSSWPRQLWRLGTILEIQELAEAWLARSRGILSDSAIKYLTQSTVRRIGSDPGLGTSKQRGILIDHIKRDLIPDSYDVAALFLILPDYRSNYLTNWARAVSDKAPVEAASRAIGSHLLDEGFGTDALHKWLTYHGKYGPGNISVATLVEHLALLSRRPLIRNEFIVPLVASPPLPVEGRDDWLSSAQTTEWLSHWFPEESTIRQTGALRVEHLARDVEGVLDRAAYETERLSARFRVGARQRLEFCPKLYAVGLPEPVAYLRNPRRVAVHALERTSAVFDLHLAREIDSALELLEPLDRGTPATAVTGSWAALETLLIGPGDTGNRVVVATRVARIVACSYIRLELTAMANACASTRSSGLSDELRAMSADRDRALRLEKAIRTRDVAHGGPTARGRDRPDGARERHQRKVTVGTGCRSRSTADGSQGWTGAVERTPRLTRVSTPTEVRAGPTRPGPRPRRRPARTARGPLRNRRTG